MKPPNLCDICVYPSKPVFGRVEIHCVADNRELFYLDLGYRGEVCRDHFESLKKAVGPIVYPVKETKQE